MRENPDSFDLLLLDIQMEGVSGMEYARALRQRGNRVSIIFITNCADYALEGYSVQPVHFILKPVTRELLEDALRTDIELNHKPKTMLFRTGGKSVSLAVSDIRYIESMNHSIIVHLADTDRVFPCPCPKPNETRRTAYFSDVITAFWSIWNMLRKSGAPKSACGTDAACLSDGAFTSPSKVHLSAI